MSCGIVKLILKHTYKIYTVCYPHRVLHVIGFRNKENRKAINDQKFNSKVFLYSVSGKKVREKQFSIKGRIRKYLGI